MPRNRTASSFIVLLSIHCNEYFIWNYSFLGFSSTQKRKTKYHRIQIIACFLSIYKKLKCQLNDTCRSIWRKHNWKKHRSTRRIKGLFTPSDSESVSGITIVPLGRVLLIYTSIIQTRAWVRVLARAVSWAVKIKWVTDFSSGIASCCNWFLWIHLPFLCVFPFTNVVCL